MNYFDVNAWIGTWPFRALRDNTPQALLRRLERAGINYAAVSPIEAIFHRHVQPANEKLLRDVEPYGGRLVPLATINPIYPGWEQDLRHCHEVLGLKGVRLFPQYHNYAADSLLAVRAVAACAERGLPVFLPSRLEDERQRHWMDPGQALDLIQLAKLLTQVPEATVVVSNARGLISTPLWQREELREGNWYFDLSLAEVHYVLHRDVSRMGDLADFIAAGGARHLLFGTHTPFSYPAAARVKAAVLPVDKAMLREICWARAARLLGVEISL